MRFVAHAVDRRGTFGRWTSRASYNSELCRIDKTLVDSILVEDFSKPRRPGLRAQAPTTATRSGSTRAVADLRPTSTSSRRRPGQSHQSPYEATDASSRFVVDAGFQASLVIK